MSAERDGAKGGREKGFQITNHLISLYDLSQRY